MVSTTRVFSDNLEAYAAGKRYIIDEGGTRSGKTYSILQLLFFIAYHSEKALIISVVSYALPHLKTGAMRELEEIIFSWGMVPNKNVSESTYKVGNSLIEFFGVENIAKVHGPERDILFMNEANYIREKVARQLLVRTRESVFIDFNPTADFWIDEMKLRERANAARIHSTYKDNGFLSLAQIQEIEGNKGNKHWWRVYGLGKKGRLEGAIFDNWTMGIFKENLTECGFGLDFGFEPDPDSLMRVAIDRKYKKIYWKNVFRMNRASTSGLVSSVNSFVLPNELIVADGSEKRLIGDLRRSGLNIHKAKKGPGSVLADIKTLWGYEIIVDYTSKSTEKEMNTYIWNDKRAGIPIDANNHDIDAARYISNYLIKGYGNYTIN